MLQYAGLNAATGMEPDRGNFGQFRNKLDKHWYIQGMYRHQAEAFLEAVLKATRKSTSSASWATGPSEPEAEPQC